MKETVLKGVAQPPQIFKAPYRMAVFNIILNFAAMIISFIIFGLINPLYFIISTVLIHMLLVALYRKEPHIDSILRNTKILLRKTNTAVKEDGVKYTN